MRLCAGCPPCAPSPLCDGGGTRGEGRRSSPPLMQAATRAFMRASMRASMRTSTRDCQSLCAGCPPCAPSPLCDGGGTRGEGRRSSPPHCSHPIHASMRTSTRSGKRCAVHCCGRHTWHGDKHMELQACASRKGRAGGARLLRSNPCCPLHCPETLPCPSPLRMFLRFSDFS